MTTNSTEVASMLIGAYRMVREVAIIIVVAHFILKFW